MRAGVLETGRPALGPSSPVSPTSFSTRRTPALVPDKPLPSILSHPTRAKARVADAFQRTLGRAKGALSAAHLQRNDHGHLRRLSTSSSDTDLATIAEAGMSPRVLIYQPTTADDTAVPRRHQLHRRHSDAARSSGVYADTMCESPMDGKALPFTKLNRDSSSTNFSKSRILMDDVDADYSLLDTAFNSSETLARRHSTVTSDRRSRVQSTDSGSSALHRPAATARTSRHSRIVSHGQGQLQHIAETLRHGASAKAVMHGAPNFAHIEDMVIEEETSVFNGVVPEEHHVKPQRVRHVHRTDTFDLTQPSTRSKAAGRQTIHTLATTREDTHEDEDDSPGAIDVERATSRLRAGSVRDLVKHINANGSFPQSVRSPEPIPFPMSGRHDTLNPPNDLRRNRSISASGSLASAPLLRRGVFERAASDERSASMLSISEVGPIESPSPAAPDAESPTDVLKPRRPALLSKTVTQSYVVPPADYGRDGRSRQDSIGVVSEVASLHHVGEVAAERTTLHTQRSPGKLPKSTVKFPTELATNVPSTEYVGQAHANEDPAADTTSQALWLRTGGVVHLSMGNMRASLSADPEPRRPASSKKKKYTADRQHRPQPNDLYKDWHNPVFEVVPATRIHRSDSTRTTQESKRAVRRKRSNSAPLRPPPTRERRPVSPVRERRTSSPSRYSDSEEIEEPSATTRAIHRLPLDEDEPRVTRRATHRLPLDEDEPSATTRAMRRLPLDDDEPVVPFPLAIDDKPPVVPAQPAPMKRNLMIQIMPPPPRLTALNTMVSPPSDSDFQKNVISTMNPPFSPPPRFTPLATIMSPRSDLELLETTNPTISSKLSRAKGPPPKRPPRPRTTRLNTFEELTLASNSQIPLVANTRSSYIEIPDRPCLADVPPTPPPPTLSHIPPEDRETTWVALKRASALRALEGFGGRMRGRRKKQKQSEPVQSNAEPDADGLGVVSVETNAGAGPPTTGGLMETILNGGAHLLPLGRVRTLSKTDRATFEIV
ncbi:hypothetical protein BKA62DRAFT_712741 [Auriculariales sp. MPI-PUGE-AT-0066]|nr:hypothetical protein BKA62DRAFT_712741 [Auriculariales sp. MPI-PUGE-AT-0066]